MRLSDSITLPEQLEAARLAGELIVFAGAGVSMGPPSGLPSFRELAKAIGEPRFPMTDAAAESLDHYIGHAERNGVHVQARARKRLANVGSPAPLHENLLGLFGTADRVRLITTNFDPHFSTAASAAFPGADVPHYWGPALPPGGEFRGIAYLHGALSQRHNRLILSDRDFARAYMSDGWATRFLLHAFEGRTVLFVGYGVADPLMRYLLLALPRNERWFGLWHESEVPHLKENPIAPIRFATAAGGGEFDDLNAAMKRWRWHASSPESRHGDEMKRIVAAGPPVSPIDADYVRARLAIPEGLNAFLGQARSAEWLEWTAREGFLDWMHQPSSIDPNNGPWASWCARHFVSGPTPPLLRVLRGRATELHSWMATFLARQLAATKEAWEAVPLRQFISILASQSASVRDGFGWVWLTEALVERDRTAEAIAMLRAATRVRLRLADRAFNAFISESAAESASLPALATNVGTLVEPKELGHLLEKRGEALAKGDPEGLLSIGEQRLAEAYELIDLARGAGGFSDLLSFGRTFIGDSNQDRSWNAEDVLVLLHRLALDRWAEVDEARLDAFARSRDADKRTLLRRLALYAYSRSANLDADRLLSRAEELNWTADLWVRPELYAGLRAHFPRASKAAQDRYLAHLATDAAWGEPFDEHDAHARFSMAQFLVEIAPNSASTTEFAKGQRDRHPDFGRGDPDGFLSRVEVGWGGDAPSPLSAKEMTGWGGDEAAARLVQKLDELGGSAAPHSLLTVVQQASRENPAWGMALVSAAVHLGASGVPLAESGLWGLREIERAPAGSAEFLRLISASGAAIPLHPLGSVINKWSESLDLDAVDLCDALDTAADFIYTESGAEPPGLEGHGWTEAAMNHPAGQAARVWWAVASARDKIGGKYVLSLDDAERTRWEMVAHGKGKNAANARPILGMATERLLPGDTPWAESAILPIFNVADDTDRAAQAWDGRLMQQRWSVNVIHALKPYRASMFAVSATLLPNRAEQLGDWVALLAAEPRVFDYGLLEMLAFVQGASVEALEAFARSLPRHLERLEPDVRRSTWSEMLSPYWMERRTGMPVGFHAAELAMLPTWVVSLPEVADEAAGLLRDSPVLPIEHGAGLLWDWKQDNAWVLQHSTAACQIIAYLLDCKAVQPWDAEDAANAIRAASGAGAHKAVLCEAAQKLARIAPNEGAALVAEIGC